MVSLWPWRSEDTSPASFERALSTLSTKISKSQQLLDQLRQRSRRFKALWTLYASFAYLLCVIVLAMVVGWKNWGPSEYSAIAGSPLFIYLIRTGITAYYSYRIDIVTYRLEEQQKERAKTIEKLKDATKYNSTQQLLEKYGGVPPQPPPKPQSHTVPARMPHKGQKQSQRTNIGPPATANIPQNRRIPSPPPNSQPIPAFTPMNRAPLSVPSPHTLSLQAGPPEFAPNAFGSVPQYQSYESNTEGKWYDRILDLLLGEDETSPKNRIVLICKQCRLVNGQAPPGVKHIEELGKWRCISCGGWNGEVDEGMKIVEEIKQRGEIEMPHQAEISGSEEKTIEALQKDDEKGPDERAPEENENEIDEGNDENEEKPQKIRRGHRSDSDHVKS